MAAGFVVAFAAAGHGLAEDAPGLVVLAVVSVIGYSVAGWLLVALGDRALQGAGWTAAGATFLGLGLLSVLAADAAGGRFGNRILYPALASGLALGAGTLAGVGLARTGGRVEWTVRGSDQANLLLHLAAVPALWSAFLVVDAAGPTTLVGSATLVLAAGVAAAVAAAGGRAVQLGAHPRYGLWASVLLLASHAWILVEASGLPATGARWTALLGMLLAAFPVAFSAVALYDVEARDDDLDRTRIA